MGVTKKLLCIVVVVLLCISFLLTGCLFPRTYYIGEHPELMAVATHSIPGIRSSRDDELIVLDTDQYGRTLFAVLLGNSWMVRKNYDECIVGIFVLQKSDESASYIYSEQNYLWAIISERVLLTDELIEKCFSEDAIEVLKKNNDWNVAPQNASAVLVAVPKSLNKDRNLTEETEKVLEVKVGTNIRTTFFKNDNTGKALYFICNISACYEWYLAMLDESGNLIDSDDAILRLDDMEMENMPNAITEFLQKNNWVHITALQ